MAIESYFWIPSRKGFLKTNLSNKKSRQSKRVVIYCTMKGTLLVKILLPLFDNAGKTKLSHWVKKTFGSKKQG